MKQQMKQRMNGYLRAGLLLGGVLTALIVLGFFWTPYDPNAMAAGPKLAGPSLAHLMGTDGFGRDIFSRVLKGAGTTYGIALCTVAIGAVCGTVLGAVTGYFGGIVDEIMMRILEIITAIPSLLVTILIMIAMGNSAGSLLIALCIASWCQTARVVRGQIMQLRESEYVMAAEALGERPLKIIVRHLLPNIMGILILEVATAIPGYIFQEAGLSFIGLGLKAPSISLGLLISNGQAVMNSHVNQLIFPALVLCIMVLAFNLLGDGLRNALDPKFRK